jgi:hypothetical protein
VIRSVGGYAGGRNTARTALMKRNERTRRAARIGRPLGVMKPLEQHLRLWRVGIVTFAG